MNDVLTQWWQAALAGVDSAHPGAIFLALALLPLVGVPVSPLILVAGLRLGLLGGFFLVLAAYLVNFSAGYWVSRAWLHGPLARWVERRGYRIPTFSGASEAQLILLLRVTPGLPLFAQNYLLGLARVNFLRYLIWSLPPQLVYAVAFLWLGQSMAQSSAGRIILAVALLIAVGLAVNLLRRYLRRDRSATGSNQSPAPA